LSKERSVARIKAELQEKGVRVAPELIPELESKYNAPAVSTGRMVLCLNSPRGGGELIPVFIVNGKRGAFSPYCLVKVSPGKFAIREDDVQYSDVTLIPRPAFYSKMTSGNTPMSKVAVIVGPGHLRSVASQRCVYQQSGQACKFCAVQYWWNAISIKQSAQIAETVEAGFEEGVVKHISLTTATLDSRDRGLANLVETARLIHDRASIPLMIEFEPLVDYALLKFLLLEAKQAGVTTVSINIECYDPGLRQDIMPAKGKIPIEEYIKNWEICLDVFGKNEVFTVAIAGIGEKDQSLLEGVEMASSTGVMTFLVPHSPAIGAVYEDMRPPGAERMLALYEKAAGIYQRHGLDICACTAGCVRGGGFSAIADVARFGV
jgi:radical SAM protein (TIGR04043 family)